MDVSKYKRDQMKKIKEDKKKGKELAEGSGRSLGEPKFRRDDENV